LVLRLSGHWRIFAERLNEEHNHAMQMVVVV
jgi:hypothetical protein